MALPLSAQTAWNDYRVVGGTVSYQGQTVADADAATFVELGFGYGRDAHNVYCRGEVLEFVNPATFEVDARFTRRHTIGRPAAVPPAAPAGPTPMATAADKPARGTGALLSGMGLGTTVSGEYRVADGVVTFDGVVVDGADAPSFEALKAGYAKDRRRAYYLGKPISGALGGRHFRYVGDDYATDGQRTYFKGREVNRD